MVSLLLFQSPTIIEVSAPLQHCFSTYVMMLYPLEFSLTLESRRNLSHLVAPARSDCAFLFLLEMNHLECGVILFASG